MTYERVVAIKEVYKKIQNHFELNPIYGGAAPELVLYYDPKCVYGFFWEGEIGINFQPCKTFKDVILTLLHEYKHYLQGVEEEFPVSYWYSSY